MAHVLYQSLDPSCLVHAILLELAIRLCLLIDCLNIFVLACWWVIIRPIGNILSVQERR